jgi:hypothetical protein
MSCPEIGLQFQFENVKPKVKQDEKKNDIIRSVSKAGDR